MFWLRLDGEATLRLCTIAWHSERQLGVEFSEQIMERRRTERWTQTRAAFSAPRPPRNSPPIETVVPSPRSPWSASLGLPEGELTFFREGRLPFLAGTFKSLPPRNVGEHTGLGGIFSASFRFMAAPSAVRSAGLLLRTVCSTFSSTHNSGSQSSRRCRWRSRWTQKGDFADQGLAFGNRPVPAFADDDFAFDDRSRIRQTAHSPA